MNLKRAIATRLSNNVTLLNIIEIFASHDNSRYEIEQRKINNENENPEACKSVKDK